MSTLSWSEAKKVLVPTDVAITLIRLRSSLHGSVTNPVKES